MFWRSHTNKLNNQGSGLNANSIKDDYTASKVATLVHEKLEDLGFSKVNNKEIARKNGLYTQLRFYKHPRLSEPGNPFISNDIYFDTPNQPWNQEYNPFYFLSIYSLADRKNPQNLANGLKWHDSDLYADLIGPARNFFQHIDSPEKAIEFFLSSGEVKLGNFIYVISPTGPLLERESIVIAYYFALAYNLPQYHERIFQRMRKYAGINKKTKEDVLMLTEDGTFPDIFK